MKCAYCGTEEKGTKEHIISCGVLDLFPECYITFDGARNTLYQADPMVKDVCATCNNNRISYIDSYAKEFIGKYFTQKYSEQDTVKIEYDYVMIQKMLLKYAFNDMRARREDCTFFDEEIINYLLNESEDIPKKNVTVLCGLAINVSPMPDAMVGNLKLRWTKNPFFYSNSTINHIDYNTGQVFVNENVERQEFPDLQISYVFRFNSGQFVLMCWNKDSEKISDNNIILQCQYPYYLMKSNDKEAILPLCTDEINYHRHEHIHVSWDLLSEVGLMRRYASGGRFEYKELYDKEWLHEEERIREEHPR